MTPEEIVNATGAIIKEFMEEAGTEAGKKRICQQSIERFRRDGVKLFVERACKELRVRERLDAHAGKYQQQVTEQILALAESHIQQAKSRLEARLERHHQKARSMPQAHAVRYLQRAHERLLAQANMYEQQSYARIQTKMEKYDQRYKERLQLHRERYGQEAMALAQKYAREYIDQQATPKGWAETIAWALAERLVEHIKAARANEPEAQAVQGIKRTNEQLEAEEQTQL